MGLSANLWIEDALARVAAEMEDVLDELLPDEDGPHARLIRAMRYATLGGGKRLRPFLVLSAAQLFDVPRGAAQRAAAALEMVHSYSLVHDDLPAMDDDDLRRGQPTTHIQFDEATAILAGDALLTLAFEILSDETTHPEAAVRCRLVSELAKAAGHDGMVGGQMIDLMGTAKAGDLDIITRQQQMKTGALIVYAVASAAILGGAGDSQRQALVDYGRDLGLAFQIADDLLDIEGSAAAMGKRAGKDVELGKATFVAALGAAGAREKAQELCASAVKRLDLFDERADLLREVSKFVINRRS